MRKMIQRLIQNSDIPLFDMYCPIKGTRNNNYWSILDVAEKIVTSPAFTYTNSATETLGLGVRS